MGLFKNAALDKSGGRKSLQVLVSVGGADEKWLKNMLRELPVKVFRSVVGSAAMYAMTPVLKAARANAPVDRGVLRGSLIKKKKSFPRNFTVWVGVGSRKKVAPHDHLIEFGHRIVRGKKTVGFVPPKPFLRPAFENNKQEVMQRYRDKLVLGIEKVAKGR